MCPAGDRYLGVVAGPIDVKLCTTVDLSSGQAFCSFSGDIFRGHQASARPGTVFGRLKVI